MPDSGFFTVEMGNRLRELRIRAHLTQAGVADRMGIRCGGNRAVVARLERGQTRSPKLETVARFLRACDARWSQFTDLLEREGLIALDLKPIEESGLSDRQQKRLIRMTEKQVSKFQIKLSPRAGAKPVHPDIRMRVVSRLRNYRLVANIIGLDVIDTLRFAPISTIAYPPYQAVARHLLGLLWRALKSEKGRAELARFAPDLPPRIREKLEQKRFDWSNQELNQELVARVQSVVLSRFLRLRKQHPELWE